MILLDGREFRPAVPAWPEGSPARIHLQWFAAEDEGRTELPSEYKIRKAREEGRVAKSQELVQAIGLLLPMLALVVFAPSMLQTFREMLSFFLNQACALDPVASGGVLFSAFISYFSRLVLPIAVVAMAAGIFSNVVQTGFLFSVKPITPDFSRIVPRFGQYLQKTVFSLDGLFNFGKSIVKIAIVATIAAINISQALPTFINLFVSPFWHTVETVGGIAARIVIEAAVVLLVLSVPDFLFQKRQFTESLKMTKQEVKEEYKMHEGDPLVKSRLKQRMRELLSSNMAANVPKADVVITNPTHFAVAVEYDAERMSAPMVTAKGQDEIAQRIKEIARDAKVPIMENKPLARALYAEVEIGDIIPEKYYQAIATVLAHVRKIDGYAGEAV